MSGQSSPDIHQANNAPKHVGTPDSALSVRETLRKSSAMSQARLAQLREERERILNSPIPDMGPPTPMGPPALTVQSPSTHGSSPAQSLNGTPLDKEIDGDDKSGAMFGDRTEAISAALDRRISKIMNSISPTKTTSQTPLQSRNDPYRTGNSSFKSDTSYIPHTPVLHTNVARHPSQPLEQQSRLFARPLDIHPTLSGNSTSQTTRTEPDAAEVVNGSHAHDTAERTEPSVNAITPNLVLGVNEHVVALGMPPRVQQQYCTTIKQNMQHIKQFFQETEPQPNTVDHINALFEELGKITTHFDLQGSGPVGSMDTVDPQHEAQYAESCSEKFVFLGTMLECLKTRYSRPIGIVARPGLLQQYLEMYLKAKGVRYAQYSSSMSPVELETMQIVLFPSDIQAQTISSAISTLIVAFDETCTLQPLVLIASTSTSAGKQISHPHVLRPIVYASLEHINLHLPLGLPSYKRMHRLLTALLQTQDQVGVLPEDEQDDTADRLRVFCEKALTFPEYGSDTVQWTQCPPLAITSALSKVSSDTTQGKIDATPAWMQCWPQVRPDVSMESNRNIKRSYNSVIENNSSHVKKRKILDDQDHANESGSTQQIMDSGQNTTAQDSGKLVELQEALSKKSALIQDLQQWAEIRQYEYEKLRREIGECQSRCTAAEESLNRKTREAETLKTQNKDLTASQADLKTTIKDLEARLQSHENPSIADLAGKEARIQLLEAEVATLNKRVANTQKDFEFTRQAYQQASSAAADQQSTLDEMTAELASFKVKAEGKSVEYRRLRDQDISRDLRKEINVLKADLKLRDSHIRRLDTENVELKRSRIGAQTRASSTAPKSPRGLSSRGASPAANLLAGTNGQSLSNAAHTHPMSRTGSSRSQRAA